jgi:hypothetical protein
MLLELEGIACLHIEIGGRLILVLLATVEEAKAAADAREGFLGLECGSIST